MTAAAAHVYQDSSARGSTQLNGYWLLGVLQMVTAGMAVLAAVESRDGRHAGGEQS